MTQTQTVLKVSIRQSLATFLKLSLVIILL